MRLAVTLTVATHLVACGGAASRPSPPCGATCREIDVRGPVAAHPLGGGRVAVLVLGADRALLAGVAATAPDRWRPRTLVLEPVSRDVETFASAHGRHTFVAHTDGARVGLSRLRGGALSPVASLGEVGRTPVSLTVAVRRDGSVVVSWVEDPTSVPTRLEWREGSDGVRDAPTSFTTHGGGRVAAAASDRGVVLAYASDGGVQIAADFLPNVRTVSEAPAVAVAVGSRGERAWVAWSDDGGVRIAEIGDEPFEPRTVDTGERASEPGHRVGAALALVPTRRGVLLGYQDQTSGALVAATVSDTISLETHDDTAYSRAFHVALVAVARGRFALDIGLTSRPRLRGSLRATAL